jgi:hypothetical protein
MENNFKSRKKNLLSKHKPLSENNVYNVWSVNLANSYTPDKNAARLANLEQLEKYAKNMFEGKVRFDQELYNGLQARLKIESNEALRFFNKPSPPKTNKNNRTSRRQRQTRRNQRQRR